MVTKASDVWTETSTCILANSFRGNNDFTGFHRCKTDPNLCCHSSKELYVLCYVDDLLVCGNPERTKVFTEQLSKEVLLKVEGELKPQATVCFLGRRLSIDITMQTGM